MIIATALMIVIRHENNVNDHRHRKPETEEMSGGARCCFGLLTLVAQVHPRHPHHCHHRHHYRHCHDCQKNFAEIDVFWANFIGIFLNGMFP